MIMNYVKAKYNQQMNANNVLLTFELLRQILIFAKNNLIEV